MDKLYQGLTAGDSPAVALRNAKLSHCSIRGQDLARRSIGPLFKSTAGDKLNVLR